MDDKKSPWSELVKIIREQVKGYNNLFVLLKEKEKILIRGNTKKLMALIEKENRAVDTMDGIEKRRVELVNKCVVREGKEQPTLTEVLEAAPEGVREEIEKEALALMETLNRVASLNRSNAELIKEATHFVNYNINLLTSGEREKIYSERGKMKSAEQNISGFLNRQV